eukprot:PRCOL_00002786-RA
MAPHAAAADGASAYLPRRVGEHLGSSEDEQAAYTLPHGYALEPSAEDGTGGWLAHRSDVDKPASEVATDSGDGVPPGAAARSPARASTDPSACAHLPPPPTPHPPIAPLIRVTRDTSGPGDDWVARVAFDADGAYGTDLSAARDFAVPGATKTHKPRLLVLYGSLRERSFSKLLAYECARLLEAMGADVRVFNPSGLPVRDPALEDHPKVQELRSLSLWSEGHVWVSPEMHGTITGVFKNQIDWIPLTSGSVRPSQGRTCAVLQVNGGSQSFNAVNELRKLARWMRMPCTTNQSSVAKGWKEFESDEDGGRMKDSSFRERVIDVMEEHYKFTLIMREHADFLVDRFAERKEIVAKGRLLTQAEKEKAKDEAMIESGKTAAK